MAARVPRISPADHTELVTDVGPVPKNVGALLLIDHPDAAALARVVASRLGRLARFRDRLVVPRRGRPWWQGDPGFDAARHVSIVPVGVSPSADDLYDVAVREVTAALARDRPLWRAVVLSGGPSGVGADRAVGLVLVMHHVLADGMGGLAVLRELADLPRDDAVAGPGAAGRPPARRVRAGRPRLRAAAPATSMNVATGPRRAVHVAGVDLPALRARAHEREATVNDCLLVAATGAMGEVLGHRGERPSTLVASVLVSGRAPDASARLGNQVGVMVVPVGLAGEDADRLAAVAATTRALKARPRASGAVLGPGLRLLARAGALQWFIERQRVVNLFVTNLRGPAERLDLAGAPVTRIVPVTSVAGNVAVAFAAQSYAGRLEVSVITDPDVVPEGAEIARDVGARLAALAG